MKLPLHPQSTAALLFLSKTETLTDVAGAGGGRGEGEGECDIPMSQGSSSRN